MAERCWLEIDKAAIVKNINVIREISGSKIMAVVKDNAYGMGMETAKLLEENGIGFFAVATLAEAIRLRELAVNSDILILGRTSEADFEKLLAYKLTQSIVSWEYARQLNAYPQKINCHLNIDTGMHRNGINCNPQEIRAVFALEGIELTGIYTHLAAADCQSAAAVARTKHQLGIFKRVLKDLQESEIDYGITHVLNSGGVLNYPEYHFDYVRPGLLLTGMTADQRFEPVFSWKSRIISIHNVSAADMIGYGVESQVVNDGKVAVVAVGYGDGLDRHLKGMNVYINDQPCPIIANICMDMIIIEVSGVECQPGSEVVIYPRNRTILSLASQLDTIVNELLVRINERVERIVI